MATGESTFVPLATSAVREISTQKGPGFARRFLTRGLPILLLASIVIWAGTSLLAPEAIPTGGNAHSIEDRDNEDNNGNGSDDNDIDEDLPLAGQKIGALLGLRMSKLAADQEVASIEDFRDAIKTQRVTVLNLWATWCEPCKQELPDLQRTLAKALSRDNGDKVHFVPVLVDNTTSIEEARTFYSDLGGPPPAAFVQDSGLNGGIRGALIEIGIIEDKPDEQPPLPTTLLIDCHRRLRWQHTGLLSGADLETFEAALANLQAELGTASCRRKRRRRKRKYTNVAKERTTTSDNRGLSDTDNQTQGLPELRPVPHDTDSPESGSDERDSDEPSSWDAYPTLKRAPSVVDRPPSACHTNGTCEVDRGETPFNCPTDCKPVL